MSNHLLLSRLVIYMGAATQELTQSVAPRKEGRYALAPSKRRGVGNSQVSRAPKKGQPISFKPTEAMRAFFEAQRDALDISISEIARRSAELYRDLYERLGGDWVLVEHRARNRGESVGVTLSSMVRSALEQERKSRK